MTASTPDPCDGTWLGERALAVVDPLAGVVTAGLNCAVTVLEWSPDGHRLAIGAASGELVVATVSPGTLA